MDTIHLPGYEVKALAFSSEKSLLYRGRRGSDGQPVMIKLPLAGAYRGQLHAQAREEYAIGRELQHPGIARYLALEEADGVPVIITEEFGGVSLREYLRDNVLSVEDFLKAAVSIAGALGAIHAAKIVHKDINPSNIVINPETDELRIIDFGAASRIRKELIEADTVLEQVTLPYLSPEQTGRAAKLVTYRTDFYSLGITFYEMLAGRPPYEAESDAALIYAHLARPLPDLRGLRPDVPAAIVRIIGKLTNKNPEERYKGAAGLLSDLQRCREAWAKSSAIEDFMPGLTDISPVLQVPEKLYGRERELEEMVDCMEHVCDGGIGILLISGYSGIGKSSLVMELQRSVAHSRGHFIAGKFDQFQRDIPYSAIIASYRQFLRRLLGEDEARIAIWKERFICHLGADAGLITAVLPELELLIGPQPTVQIEDPEKLEIRFISAFRGFIRAISADGTPTVLFLDDLQWIDLASLQLVMNMLGLIQPGEQHYILLVGAYRDNEVGPEHPLHQAIQELGRRAINVRKLELGPLNTADVNQLVAETLEAPPEQCTQLSGLIMDKTGGNPFFVSRFLDSLYDAGLIAFDNAAAAWRWDMEGIRKAAITDNVLELITSNIATLSPATREVLKLASCLGQRFTDADLRELSGQDEPALSASLEEATNEGLVFKIRSEARAQYSFQHDRLQDAAYRLIPPDALPGLHLQIGRFQLQKARAEHKLEDELFAILTHLNTAAALITDEAERTMMADFNLRAGQRARQSAAYQSGLSFAQKGIEFLGEGAWQGSGRPLAHGLNLLGAECAYLLAEHSTMHRFTDELLAHLSTPMERLAVHEILGYSYSQRQMWKESMTESLLAVKEFGVHIPLNPTKLTVMRYLSSTMLQIRFIAPEKLETLPLLDNAEIESVMRVLISAISAAYLSDTNAFAVLVMALVRLNVKHGNSIYAGYVYTAFGILLGGALGLIPLGWRYAASGKRIFDRHPHENSLAKVYFSSYCFADHWKNDVRGSFPHLVHGYHTGIAKGDREYANWCLSHKTVYGVLAGNNLHELEAELATVVQVCAGQNQVLGICNIFQKYTLWLLGKGAPEDDPIDAAWDDADTLNYEALKYRSALMEQYLLLSYRHLNYGNWASAWHYACASVRLKDATIGMYYLPVCLFGQALAGLRLASTGKLPLRKAKGPVAEFKKWALLNPVNHGHRYTLIQAELAALTRNHTSAEHHYESAIREAREHRHVQDVALICELAAGYFKERGNEAKYINLITEAHKSYERWGAARLTARLERAHADALRSGLATTTEGGHSTSGRLMGHTLDLKAIISASEAISGEMELDRLLPKIIQVVVENAGAERVVLLLESGEDFELAAAMSPGEAIVLPETPVPLAQYPLLSASVVQYVIRSRSPLVVDDASKDARFADEPYIRASGQRSLLCLPLVKSGAIRAIVYLENKLMSGAFTPERVETLNLLSAQAAIALENAIYYRDMRAAYRRIEQLNVSYERFVPRQFLALLERESITDISLADHSQRDMPVLFSDVRNFTSISEQLSPQEVFNLLNDVFGVLIPCVQEAGGVIDKFIGDAIMALFPGSADDALRSAVAMNRQLQIYNEGRAADGLQPIKVGIGLHAGPMILGTVGSHSRLNTTVIGDTVNIAARLESATKEFNTSLIVSAVLVERLQSPEAFRLRHIGFANVKGKAQGVRVYEEYSGDAPDVIAKKEAMAGSFETIMCEMAAGDLSRVADLLEHYCTVFPDDTIAAHYKRQTDKALLPEAIL